MPEEHWDAAKIDKAKKLAEGPLGEQMGKFPMRFAKVVFFGDLPGQGTPRINNGSASLLKLNGTPLAVTCSHVLQGFRDRLTERGNALIQIGPVRLDLSKRQVSESRELDLATIVLTENEAREINADGEIGSAFFEPVQWPPTDVCADDYVAFGGFPGKWREIISEDELVFGSFSSGACRIATVNDTYFVCQFEREYWAQSFNYDKREALDQLGGLSGGPVFILRKLHWEFLGIIYEFSEALDLMYVRCAQFIGGDGYIKTSNA